VGLTEKKLEFIDEGIVAGGGEVEGGHFGNRRTGGCNGLREHFHRGGD